MQAAIVGFRTGKVLYFGVKNKFCMICQRAANKGENPRDHQCYKNYSEGQSASSMEAAIIVEGFKSSLSEYGVIYNKMVADGDSSVYNKIVKANPYKDEKINVQKIECRNHLLRNYIKKLRLVAETGARIHGTGYFRRLIGSNLLKLRVAITSAIKYRKDEESTNLQKVSDLRRDILNSPRHIFGDHSACAPYFCKGPKENEKNQVTEMVKTVVWEQMNVHVKFLASNAKSLICDLDNNPAEHFNAILTKYTGGKRTNMIQRFGYNAACASTCISHNGSDMHYDVHKTMTGYSPGLHTKKLIAAKFKKNRANQRTASKTSIKKHVFKGRAIFNDPDYGDCVLPVMIPEEYDKKVETFFNVNFKKTREVLVDTERKTIMQRDDPLWLDLHRITLTSSLFHLVCRKQPATSCANTVIKMLYNTVLNVHMQYGIDHEEDALAALSEKMNIVIQKCGMFIHPIYQYLGATPDGLVGIDITIEVKCASAAASKNLTPEEGIRAGLIKFWKIKKDGTFIINKKDKWYSQVQGTLNITGRKTCIFAVWTPKGIKIETIERDEAYWENEMLPRLQKFYMDCILPEIINPCYEKTNKIRDPDYIIKAQEEKEAEKAAAKDNPKKKKRKQQEDEDVNNISKINHISVQPKQKKQKQTNFPGGKKQQIKKKAKKNNILQHQNQREVSDMPGCSKVKRKRPAKDSVIYKDRGESESEDDKWESEGGSSDCDEPCPIVWSDSESEGM